MSSLAESRPHRSLNDWLVGQLIHQDINSFEALLNVARDHADYEQDRETGAIVTAKVWQDRGKLRGYASEFECRLLMSNDSRRGANAIVVLMDLRRRWKKGARFALTSRAVGRPIAPELKREAFEGAVKLLVETGCITKVRNFRADYHGNHDAAQYELAAIRETGELPEREEAAQGAAASPPEPQQASPVQPDVPPPTPIQEAPRQPEPVYAASQRQDGLLVPETDEEHQLIASWAKFEKEMTPEIVHREIASYRKSKAERDERERRQKLEEEQRQKAQLEVCEGMSEEDAAVIAEYNDSAKRNRRPPLTREQALRYLESKREWEAGEAEWQEQQRQRAHRRHARAA